jgi:hypothetical protein
MSMSDPVVRNDEAVGSIPTSSTNLVNQPAILNLFFYSEYFRSAMLQPKLSGACLSLIPRRRSSTDSSKRSSRHSRLPGLRLIGTIRKGGDGVVQKQLRVVSRYRCSAAALYRMDLMGKVNHRL